MQDTLNIDKLNAHCTHGPKTVGAPSRGSVQHPSGPPAVCPPKALRGDDRPRALSLHNHMEGVDPRTSPGGCAGDETWPQTRVPRGGPEPSRAQLLQGRAASEEPQAPTAPGLPLANPETVPPCPSLVLWCASRPDLFPLARRTRSRSVTRPPLRQGGGAAVGKVRSGSSPRPGELRFEYEVRSGGPNRPPDGGLRA